jgi:hypothetical protein
MSDQEIRSSENHFAIGEIAIWLDSDDGYDEVTITGPIEIIAWYLVDDATQRGLEPCHRVQYSDGDFGYEPIRFLKKKRPPAREDHQLTTWDRCLWQPQQVRA